jgi:hypothetical protein
MSETPYSIFVHIDLPADSTSEEREGALSQLRRELLETDVKSVESNTDL